MAKTISAETLFIQAIKAAPDDDLPRLVFADWLDENDQGERAAFIRWQCYRPKADGELLDVIAKRKLSPGANCVRFKDCIQTHPWSQRNFADHIGKQPANRVVVVMNKGRSAAVVWHRGFIAAVYCSTVSITRKVVAALYGHPVRVFHLRGELGSTRQVSSGMFALEWNGHQHLFPDATRDAYDLRWVATDAADVEVLRKVFPTVNRVTRGHFTAKAAAENYLLG